MDASTSIALHFEGKDPLVQEIYEQLLACLRGLGEVHEAPKKTAIHLDRSKAFAAVYPRSSYLNLQFRTDREIEHPRIQKIEQLSTHRYLHMVKLEQEDDVDERLLAWLKEAYDLAG